MSLVSPLSEATQRDCMNVVISSEKLRHSSISRYQSNSRIDGTPLELFLTGTGALASE